LLPPGDLGEDPRGARTAADDRLGGGCLRPGARRGGARARGAALPAHRRAGSGRVIDTHAHLDACDEDAGELLVRARAAGVTRVVTIGTGIESCRAALAIADAHGLPVVIHSRAASVETAAVLALFPGTVVLHCFSEPDLLDPALERGYY